jgi:hypothetical protein
VGPDYSPLLCNIYLTSWEYKALHQATQAHHAGHTEIQTVKEWSYFFRMMDDVCLLNAPTLQ